MSDSKISALPTKAVPISADILPIVDSTVTDNKKITIGSLPISTATQTALNAKVTGNAAIVAATKTKITYDTKGLVTSGADATTADIADSLNKRYVTDAQLTVISNTSGTNTGDQDLSTLALKATTISTTAPLTGGGDLSANRTLSIPAATALADGYLTSANWTTFNSKESAIAAGTIAQYWRGDKSFQTLDKAAVGLGNVDNTSDANKPVSTATQTALNLKVNKAGDTMTGELIITGANGSEFGGLQVNNTNTAGYCAIDARADDGEVIQIAALNSGGAGNAYGMWTANQFGLYSKRTLNILTDTAGAEIKFATGTGAIEVAKIDSTGKFSSNGISLNSGTVENVPTPTVSTHAANKEYVDIQSIVKALIFG